MRAMVQLLVCLLAIGLVAVPRISAAADVQELPRTISTTGEAAIYAVPDEVVVTLGVTNVDPVLDKALSTNADACARLAKAIKGVDIDEKDVSTTELTVEPQYSYEQGRSYTIGGYTVRRAYTVTVKSIDKFENLIETALKNGANQISGLEFSTSQSRKYHDQARADAIHAAREKAEALASEMGCKAGMPRTITENLNNEWDYRAASLNRARSSDEGIGEGGILPSGQIAVRASITVTFDLLAQ